MLVIAFSFAFCGLYLAVNTTLVEAFTLLETVIDIVKQKQCQSETVV